jgi:hypothetical protein
MLDFDTEVVEQYGESYARPQMMIQLGKILDSEENPYPINTVITDDGYSYEMSSAFARKMLAVIRALPTQRRRDIISQIQFSDGFDQFVEVVEEVSRMYAK